MSLWRLATMLAETVPALPPKLGYARTPEKGPHDGIVSVPPLAFMVCGGRLAGGEQAAIACAAGAAVAPASAGPAVVTVACEAMEPPLQPETNAIVTSARPAKAYPALAQIAWRNGRRRTTNS